MTGPLSELVEYQRLLVACSNRAAKIAFRIKELSVRLSHMEHLSGKSTFLWTGMFVSLCLFPPLILGILETYDGNHAIMWTAAFAAELRSGNVLPRWVWELNVGFGSPVFFFYAPLGFYLPAALSELTGMSAAASLVASLLFWRVLACATAYLWLRQLVPPNWALVGAALSLLNGYNVFYSPFIRFGYSEMAATAVLPLLFLACHAATISGLFLRLVPALTVLIWLHLPMALLGNLAVVLYALALPGDRVRRFVAVCGASALAAACAALYLFPALSLLPNINAQAWDFRYHHYGPEWHLFPFVAGLERNRSVIWNHFLVQCVALNLAFAVPLVTAFLAARRDAFRVWRIGCPATVTLVLLVLLVTPLALPIWLYMPILPRVQFPWRLLPILSLLTAAVLVIVASHAQARVTAQGGPAELPTGLLAWLTAVLAAVSFVLLSQSVVLEQNEPLTRWMSYTERTDRPRLRNYVGPPEYRPATPAAASATFGVIARRGEYPFPGVVTVPVVRSAGSNEGVARGPFDPGRPVLLSQFWFPGWLAKHDGVPLPIDRDPVTGLIRVTPLTEVGRIVLSRVVTTEERIGAVLSAAGIGLYSCIAVATLVRRRRPDDAFATG